jgi:DNA-binding GntR family transcriptional regulator
LLDANLTRRAVEQIRIAIVHGQFDFGEPLSENELARALGVSKAPIRAALNELRLKGLVEIVPQSGSYVFRPTSQQIVQLCDFRALLELEALAAAISNDRAALLASLTAVVAEMETAFREARWVDSKRFDGDFHGAIIRHSRNVYLISAYETIALTVEALRYRFMDTVLYRNKAFEEHQQILKLLQLGKTSKVWAILREHISRTRNFQSDVIWSHGRLQRRDYRFRDYATVFRTEAG